MIGVATSPTGSANARPTFSNYLTKKDNYSKNDKINTFGSYLATCDTLYPNITHLYAVL